MTTRHDWKRLGACVVGCLCVIGTARADRCAAPGEQGALNARVLQTELMVTALACGYRADYNSFVSAHRAELALRGGVLRDYFERHYGARAEAELNRFVTRLANQESARSNASREHFCSEGAALFTRLGGRADFASVVDSAEFAVVHGVPSCPSAGSSALPAAAASVPAAAAKASLPLP